VTVLATIPARVTEVSHSEEGGTVRLFVYRRDVVLGDAITLQVSREAAHAWSERVGDFVTIDVRKGVAP
jgi:hypothetical protein